MPKSYLSDDDSGGFYYNLSGEEDIVLLQSKLIDAGRRVKDYTPAWGRILSLLIRHNRQTILSKGASIGKPWAPLTEDYQIAKLRKGGGRAIGKLTGALIRQATSMSSGRVSKNSVELGTHGLPYSVFVKFGVQQPKVLGRRALFWWTGQLRNKTRGIILDHLRASAEKAGLTVG